MSRNEQYSDNGGGSRERPPGGKMVSNRSSSRHAAASKPYTRSSGGQTLLGRVRERVTELLKPSWFNELVSGLSDAQPPAMDSPPLKVARDMAPSVRDDASSDDEDIPVEMDGYQAVFKSSALQGGGVGEGQRGQFGGVGRGRQRGSETENRVEWSGVELPGMEASFSNAGRSDGLRGGFAVTSDLRHHGIRGSRDREKIGGGGAVVASGEEPRGAVEGEGRQAMFRAGGEQLGYGGSASSASNVRYTQKTNARGDVSVGMNGSGTRHDRSDHSRLWSTTSDTPPPVKPAFNISTFLQPIERIGASTSINQNVGLHYGLLGNIQLNRSGLESSFYGGRTAYGGASAALNASRNAAGSRGGSGGASSPYERRGAIQQSVQARPSNAFGDVGATSATARRILASMSRDESIGRSRCGDFSFDEKLFGESRRVSAYESYMADSPLSFTPSTYRRHSSRFGDAPAGGAPSGGNFRPPASGGIFGPPVRPLVTPTVAVIKQSRVAFNNRPPIPAQESRLSAPDAESAPLARSPLRASGSESMLGKAKKPPKHYSAGARADDDSTIAVDPALTAARPLAVTLAPGSFGLIPGGSGLGSTALGGIGASASAAKNTVVASVTKQFSFSTPKDIVPGFKVSGTNSPSPTTPAFQFSAPAELSGSLARKILPPGFPSAPQAMMFACGSLPSAAFSSTASSQAGFKFGGAIPSVSSSSASGKESAMTVGSSDSDKALASMQPSLSDLFRNKSAGKWTCGECYVENSETTDSCVACTTPRQSTTVVTVSGNSSMANLVTVNLAGASSTSSQTSLAAMFGKKAPGTWTCPTCMVSGNKDGDSHCGACNEPKPGPVVAAGPALPSLSTALGKKAPGTWSCPLCMVTGNKEEDSVCCACGEKKPGSVLSDNGGSANVVQSNEGPSDKIQIGATGGFKFGSLGAGGGFGSMPFGSGFKSSASELGIPATGGFQFTGGFKPTEGFIPSGGFNASGGFKLSGGLTTSGVGMQSTVAKTSDLQGTAASSKEEASDLARPPLHSFPGSPPQFQVTGGELSTAGALSFAAGTTGALHAAGDGSQTFSAGGDFKANSVENSQARLVTGGVAGGQAQSAAETAVTSAKLTFGSSSQPSGLFSGLTPASGTGGAMGQATTTPMFSSGFSGFGAAVKTTTSSVVGTFGAASVGGFGLVGQPAVSAGSAVPASSATGLGGTVSGGSSVAATPTTFTLANAAPAPNLAAASVTSAMIPFSFGALPATSIAKASSNGPPSAPMFPFGESAQKPTTQNTSGLAPTLRASTGLFGSSTWAPSTLTNTSTFAGGAGVSAPLMFGSASVSSAGTSAIPAVTTAPQFSAAAVSAAAAMFAGAAPAAAASTDASVLLQFGSSVSSATNFGIPAAATASSFGASSTSNFNSNSLSSFGSTAPATVPSFGAGFGTLALGTSQSGIFKFGSTSTGAAQPMFGAATQAPLFGSAGSAAGVASPVFGAQANSSVPGSASTFGATNAFGGATNASPFGSGSVPQFGNAAASNMPNFGASSVMPNFGAPTPNFSLQTSAPMFGAPTATPNFGASTSFPNFGSVFGQQQSVGLTVTAPVFAFGSQGGAGGGTEGATAAAKRSFSGTQEGGQSGAKRGSAAGSIDGSMTLGTPTMPLNGGSAQPTGFNFTGVPQSFNFSAGAPISALNAGAVAPGVFQFGGPAAPLDFQFGGAGGVGAAGGSNPFNAVANPNLAGRQIKRGVRRTGLRK